MSEETLEGSEGSRPRESPPSYPVPARLHTVEETVRRSRFIATLGPASDAGAAQALVRAVREQFPDATHHCWAYVAGPPGTTAHVGMSDDGEPHGTAGRPILTRLLHSGFGDVAAVVTRYYGGVKLGRGGLGRAYAGAVDTALASLPRRMRVSRIDVLIEVDYPAVDGLLRVLDGLGAVRGEEDFAERVRVRSAVPTDALEALERAVADLSSGTGAVKRLDAGHEG